MEQDEAFAIVRLARGNIVWRFYTLCCAAQRGCKAPVPMRGLADLLCYGWSLLAVAGQLARVATVPNPGHKELRDRCWAICV